MGDDRIERLAPAALVAAMVLSAATILALGADLRFWSDELSWLTEGRDFAPDTLLTPHNGHLIAIPRSLYELGPRLFDTSYLPFRLVGIAGVLAVAGLTFTLVRSRLGAAVALAPATVLLFFGAASEVVLTPLGIPFSLSIALGLGAFAAVERSTPRADLLAGALLAGSMLAHTFGTIFAIGVLTYLAASRAPLRRMLPAAIPLAAWVAWYLWARQFDQGITDSSNIAGAPLFVVETAATSLAAIAGVSRSAEGLQADVVAAVFIPVVLVLGFLLARHVRRHGTSPWLLAYLATAIVFWVGIALSANEDREPTTPRYLYFGAIMLFLIASEAARGWRPGPRTARVVVAATCLCVAANVVRLGFAKADFDQVALEVGAQIAALEVGREVIDPDFQPVQSGPPATEGVYARAGPLRDFADRYGSLGFSAGELSEQPEEIREGADFVLARGLGILAVPSSTPARGCRPAAGDSSLLELPAGPSVLVPSATGELLVGRFADQPTVEVGSLTAGEPALVVVPEGEAGQGWIASVPGPVEVCRA